MKISSNWLQDYVKFDLLPEALSDLLTMCGLEVEDIETMGSSLDGVIVGRVLDTRKHPNADQLTLCMVDLGTDEHIQIACGAPNVKSGQKVPVATRGTTLMLPNQDDPETRMPFKLQRTKIRGEVSDGMICAEDELGISDDHTGIMVLDDDAPIGQPFNTYLSEKGFSLCDVVFDLAITPNRPDAVSHIGVARDVAALTGAVLQKPIVALPVDGGEASKQVEVEIEAPSACPRYVGILVCGVTIKESPQWLKQRLSAIGLRPRNNVVDITNYVMYECGQPLHAFDYDQVAGAKIIVRLTKNDHPFVTLDSKERALPEGTLMICDAEREVAVAGVMGGENSEVTDLTKNILIESAYFDPATIRRAAKALSLQTDASYRFERGVDADGQVWAAARAAQLIAELAGGEIVPGMVDAHPMPWKKRDVVLRPDRVKKVLGVDVPKSDMRRLLKAIGFEIALEEKTQLHCIVPSFRPDIEREIDIIEEIARLYGYDNIIEPEWSRMPNTVHRDLPSDKLRGFTRAHLAGQGYREIYTNSMLHLETALRFNLPQLNRHAHPDSVVETLNPISQEMSALRPSLLPGLLQVMSFNQNHGQRLLRFMEFGHVFCRTGIDEPTVIPGYAEHESFIIAVCGPQYEVGWDTEERMFDLFDLKGTIASILQTLRIPRLTMRPDYESTSVTAFHLNVYSGETRIGILAGLNDTVTSMYDLKSSVFFAELDWQSIVGLAGPQMQRQYKNVSRFPVVDRDLAVTVDRRQTVGPLIQTIREAGSKMLQQVNVFDLYEDERLGTGKKSIAFALRFGSDRTLKDKEVDAQISRILKRLKRDHGAELRQ